MTKVIPRESRRITYSSEIRQLKTVPFTENQRAIVVGSVLGDGCLHVNWSKTNYTLKITRSEKQKDYVEWQYQQLQPFVRTAPRWYEPTRSYTMRTISHSELTALHAEFYPNGKKILPEQIAKYMANPLVLVVWFMDDGNAKSVRGELVGYHLNTQSFTLEENVLIADIFQQLYGIRPHIERNHKYYRIGISARASREKFYDLVKDLVIPSMQYKLG